MSPKVSVIVPVYNVAAHVGPCIESLAAQSFADFEVIVVDDGSTDGSGSRAQAAAGHDPRFVFLNRANGGLSAARNTGMDAAQGSYLCFVDSDDIVAPDYLEALVTALEESGLDWVCCGIDFVQPDGTETHHSGLHGDPDPGKTPQRHDMGNWNEIVRIFPSAWNKIYRRDLVGDLRFDEGLNYEDHAFYYRYAERAGDLLRLPDLLYRNTRGRDGQITGDGSEKVFQQFEVLEILRGIMEASAKPGADDAYRAILTRLSFERADVIADPRRRVRFVAQAREMLVATGGAPDPRLGVAAGWVAALEGRVAVTVVIPSNGAVAPLQATLQALQVQRLPGIEILVVEDRGALPSIEARRALFETVADNPGAAILVAEGGISAARNRGLDAARGEAVVFLDAGDTLPPRALMAWHHRLHSAKAAMTVARMRFRGPQGKDTAHSGLHEVGGLSKAARDPDGFVPGPDEAVCLHVHPSAKMFDRAFLQRHDIRFPKGPLAAWEVVLRVAAAASGDTPGGKIVYLEKQPPAEISTRAECRQTWRAPIAAPDLARAVNRIAGATPGFLTRAQQARLLVRAIWEKVNFADFADPMQRNTFESEARQALADLLADPEVEGDADDPDDRAALPLDPYIGPRLRRILDLPEQDRQEQDGPGS